MGHILVNASLFMGRGAFGCIPFYNHQFGVIQWGGNIILKVAFALKEYVTGPFCRMKEQLEETKLLTKSGSPCNINLHLIFKMGIHVQPLPLTETMPWYRKITHT